MPKKNIEKRVLHLLCFPLWGSGSGTYARELAVETNKDSSITAAMVCPEFQEKIPEIKIYPLDFPFPVAFTGHPDWPNCRLYKDLSAKEITDIFRYFLISTARAVEDFKPDIIHVHHASVFLWVVNLIKLLYKVNFIVTVHGTGIATAEKNKIYVAPSQEPLIRAKKIISVSGDTKEWLLRVFNRELSDKTRIIPGGAHVDAFPLDKKIKIINKKYNLKGKKIVLFAGKLTEQKGVYYLVKAAKNIKGDVYIIGDGPDKKIFEDIIVKRDLKNVHLLGYMGDDKKEELREFYYRADVFVAPSVWDEPLGLVILEAMSCKTPVVATRKGGIPLAVKDGFNGFLIRSKNSTQIAEACNKILDNEKMRKKMGEAARQTVEQKFTWNKIAKKYIRIYKRYWNK
jgi:glycosyltransferase involved in cell wall biosynthesis